MTYDDVFGAYSKQYDWFNLASIRATESGVRKWIRDTYIGGHDDWLIVPVTVSAKIPSKLKRAG